MLQSSIPFPHTVLEQIVINLLTVVLKKLMMILMKMLLLVLVKSRWYDEVIILYRVKWYQG